VIKLVLLLTLCGTLFVLFLGWLHAKPVSAERLRGPLDKEEKT